MTYPAKMRELAKSLRECEWNHPIDAAATCENVAAELERLERIEAALPKTADGVTIVSDMTVYSDHYRNGVKVTGFDTRNGKLTCLYFGNGFDAICSGFYSSREALEAAEKARDE